MTGKQLQTIEILPPAAARPTPAPAHADDRIYHAELMPHGPAQHRSVWGSPRLLFVMAAMLAIIGFLGGKMIGDRSIIALQAEQNAALEQQNAALGELVQAMRDEQARIEAEAVDAGIELSREDMFIGLIAIAAAAAIAHPAAGAAVLVVGIMTIMQVDGGIAGP